MATTDDTAGYDPRDDSHGAYRTDRKGSYLIDFDGGGKYLMRPAAGGAGEFLGGSVCDLVALLAEDVHGLSVTDDFDESPDVFGVGRTWAEVLAVVSTPDSPGRDVVLAIYSRVSWAQDYLPDAYAAGKRFWTLTPEAVAADAAVTAEAKGGP